jgi:prepilin-type N-terminal cleavage/methylation domain-containing protein
MIRRRPAAFTLVEIILVVAIMATMAAIAMPRLGSSLDSSRVDRAARKLADDLELARTAAMARSTPTSISLDISNSTWQLNGIVEVGMRNPDSRVLLTEPPLMSSFVREGHPGSLVLHFSEFGIPSQKLSLRLQSGNHFRTVTISRPGGAVLITP